MIEHTSGRITYQAPSREACITALPKASHLAQQALTPEQPHATVRTRQVSFRRILQEPLLLASTTAPPGLRKAVRAYTHTLRKHGVTISTIDGVRLPESTPNVVISLLITANAPEADALLRRQDRESLDLAHAHLGAKVSDRKIFRRLFGLPQRPRYTYAPGEKAHIRGLSEAGTPIPEIARQTGRPEKSIRTVLGPSKAPHPGTRGESSRRTTTAEKLWLIQEHHKGAGWKQAAHTLGISRPTAVSILDSHPAPVDVDDMAPALGAEIYYAPEAISDEEISLHYGVTTGEVTALRRGADEDTRMLVRLIRSGRTQNEILHMQPWATTQTIEAAARDRGLLLGAKVSREDIFRLDPLLHAGVNPKEAASQAGLSADFATARAQWLTSPAGVAWRSNSTAACLRCRVSLARIGKIIPGTTRAYAESIANARSLPLGSYLTSLQAQRVTTLIREGRSPRQIVQETGLPLSAIRARKARLTPSPGAKESST